MTDQTLQTMEDITARLDCFSFWKLYTKNKTDPYSRRYVCEIRAHLPGRAHRFTAEASATTKHDACRACIRMVENELNTLRDMREAHERTPFRLVCD